jgi:hypothetical protein
MAEKIKNIGQKIKMFFLVFIKQSISKLIAFLQVLVEKKSFKRI